MKKIIYLVILVIIIILIWIYFSNQKTETESTISETKSDTVYETFEGLVYPKPTRWTTRYKDAHKYGNKFETTTIYGSEGITSITSYDQDVCDEISGICDESISETRIRTVEEVYQEHVIQPGYCHEKGEEDWSKIPSVKIVECQSPRHEVPITAYYLTSGPKLMEVLFDNNDGESFEEYVKQFKKEARFE